MQPLIFADLMLRVRTERWPFVDPFRISGHIFEGADVAVVELEKDGAIGRGEAAGIFYLGETAASVAHQIESVRCELTAEMGRALLLELLPAGGARNAIDCALWDLEAKLSGIPTWQRAGLSEPRRLLTTFTCGAGTPAEMVATARGFAGARALKLKLTGEAIDGERVRAVRAAFPNCWLGVDANQGMDLALLAALLPTFEQARVALIEQPLAADVDYLLDDFAHSIPIAADESAQTIDSLASLVGRFDMVNIKLDKCGGLTAALAMADVARRLGLKVMVGNMPGTSLGMAPAFLLGQLCDIVDLDGPTLLKADRAPATIYNDGEVELPETWGYP